MIKNIINKKKTNHCLLSSWRLLSIPLRCWAVSFPCCRIFNAVEIKRHILQRTVMPIGP